MLFFKTTDILERNMGDKRECAYTYLTGCLHLKRVSHVTDEKWRESQMRACTPY